MKPDVHHAAQSLLRKIDAPKGAVNTCTFWEQDEPVITVLIDPLYWHAIKGVPQTFRGYRVVVEKREPIIAFH